MRRKRTTPRNSTCCLGGGLQSGGIGGKFYRRQPAGAAAVGGVTTVLDMPNTNPAVLDGVNVRKKIAYFHDKAYVDYGIWGLSLGDLNLDKLLSMKEAGAAAIKFFWGYAIDAKTHALIYNYTRGQENVIPPLDDGEVYAIFRQIAANRQILAIHAENSALIRRLTEELATSKTADDDYAAFLSTRPSLAEELTVATAISMARDTGAHLHILHMTSRRGVELVAVQRLRASPSQRKRRRTTSSYPQKTFPPSAP